MVAFTYSMPAGIAGDVTRGQHSVVEPNQFDTTTPPTAFGQVVKLVSGKIQQIAASDAATVIYGFLVRPFPAQGTAQAPALGAAAPDKNQAADVLVRGYLTVALARGTPNKGDLVYVRVATGGLGGTVGQIETTADAGNAVEVGHLGSGKCTFMGAADAGGFVEISYNI